MRKRSKVQRLLAIMIGAAMLAGCGSSDTQQVPQDTATEENSAVSAQESTQAQGTNEKSESGEQVTIQYWIREHHRQIRNLYRNVWIPSKQNILI